MNCLNMIKLIGEVIWGICITTFLIFQDWIYWIIPRRKKSIKNDIILVTGTGHGLGRRIAINFARMGALVVCWDKDTEKNTSTVWDIRHLGGRAVGFTVDVSDRKEVLETARKVMLEVGHITMLVNNVGIYPVKPVIEWNLEELTELIHTNFFSHFWTLQAFLPNMIEMNKGHVVAISSAAAIAPVMNEVPYSASKSAVSGLLDGLLHELRQNSNNNIKITTVHPYYTCTRTDLPVKFDLRFDRLSPDYVAAEIVKGILEERETMTVPRFMEFWICLLRCLPQGARRRWRDIFFTRVYPEPISTSVHMGNEKLIKTDKFIHGEEHPLPTLVNTSSPSETMSGVVNKGYSKDSDINELEDTLEKKLEETNMDTFNESLANPISKSDYEANKENLKETKVHKEIIQ